MSRLQRNEERRLPSIAGRVPPHDLDAEAAVLSACMLKENVVGDVVAVLRPEHFYSPANALIFGAIEALSKDRQPVDSVQVASWLRSRDKLAEVGGIAHIAEIVDATPAVQHVTSHAQIVHERWLVRRVIAEAQLIAAEAYGDIGESTQSFLLSSAARISQIAETGSVDGDGCHVAISLREAFQEINDRANGKGLGLLTGIRSLDACIGGMGPGSLTVIAAPSHVGKSSLVRQIALRVALDERAGVALWSGEQPHTECSLNIEHQHAGVRPKTGITNDTYTADEWRRLTESATLISATPLWMHDSPGADTNYIHGMIRRRKRDAEAGNTKLKLAVVDYIQILQHVGRIDQRTEQVASVVKALKRIALQEQVAILTCSQLNENGDARESREIFNSADKFIAIENLDFAARKEAERDEQQWKDPTPERVKLTIRKARGGGTCGTVRATFYPTVGRFEDKRWED